MPSAHTGRREGPCEPTAPTAAPTSCRPSLRFRLSRSAARRCVSHFHRRHRPMVAKRDEVPSRWPQSQYHPLRTTPRRAIIRVDRKWPRNQDRGNGIGHSLVPSHSFGFRVAGGEFCSLRKNGSRSSFRGQPQWNAGHINASRMEPHPVRSSSTAWTGGGGVFARPGYVVGRPHDILAGER